MLRVPLHRVSSEIASENWNFARSSAGLLLSLTNSSIIPENVARASSTRTTSHFLAQRSGNALYMYFKVRVCFFLETLQNLGALTINDLKRYALRAFQDHSNDILFLKIHWEMTPQSLFDWTLQQVHRYGFCLSQSPEGPHEQHPIALMIGEQLFSLLFVVWITPSSNGKQYMGFRRAPRRLKEHNLLRWLGTVLGRTECANIFCQNLLLMAHACRKWYNIRESQCSIFPKVGPNIAIFDIVKYGVIGKTVTCLPSGSNFYNF